MKTSDLELYQDQIFSIKFQNSPPNGDYIELNQTHSDHVCQLSQISNSINGEDGVIFNNMEEKTIVLKTADCFPICFISNHEVALVHAGWRGVKNQIHLSPKLIALNPHTIITGPSICEDCFEVQEDFYLQFPSQKDYFLKKNNQLFFKIKTLLKDQLLAGFPDAKLILSSDCTKCNLTWHSYRRDKTTKRNFTVFQKR